MGHSSWSEEVPGKWNSGLEGLSISFAVDHHSQSVQRQDLCFAHRNACHVLHNRFGCIRMVCVHVGSNWFWVWTDRVWLCCKVVFSRNLRWHSHLNQSHPMRTWVWCEAVVKAADLFKICRALQSSKPKVTLAPWSISEEMRLSITSLFPYDKCCLGWQ